MSEDLRNQWESMPAPNPLNFSSERLLEIMDNAATVPEERIVELRNKIFETLGSKVISESQICSKLTVDPFQGKMFLPAFLRNPIAIWEELESQVDVNAVPGGPELWARVLKGKDYAPMCADLFTQQEIFKIYTMLGEKPPTQYE